MQNTRKKSFTWASFGLKHLQETLVDDDPYPPISNPDSNYANVANNNFQGKRSYSSVAQSSINLEPNRQGSRNKSSEIIMAQSSLEYLKKIHNWASEEIIQDILIATDDDKDQASNILENMDPVDPKEKSTSSYLCDKQEKKLIGNDGDCCLKVDKRKEKHIVENPISIEPEYKGNDDPYAIYRKNAIKISRIASRLSEKANTSFFNGDHRLAREYSSKAQEKWKIVKKLNENAAKEILSIRNVNNDVWTLDLHGLHAQEAISALKEHLWKIECQERSKRVSNKKTKIAEPQAMHQSKQNKLHVITGIGKHSRGEAILPTTIKEFLIENRYHFNDSRPGSYIIHPKFRC
ncbi:hypothetical protein ZOSMA_94G00520 [Zostera marina]|uniref:Smr domain-containing protein n=1 Tax=Zostera marina TaxID=29655 RepID=A0A0K9NID3_ZOSMR|nr:hypothetical protein ZOSMA_94G00520 [Zostera marina]